MGREASGKQRMTSSLDSEPEKYSDESHFFTAVGGPVLVEFLVLYISLFEQTAGEKSLGPVRRKLLYVSRVLTAKKECIYIRLFCMIL